MPFGGYKVGRGYGGCGEEAASVAFATRLELLTLFTPSPHTQLTGSCALLQESGIGREHGSAALEHYTQVRPCTCSQRTCTTVAPVLPLLAMLSAMCCCVL